MGFDDVFFVAPVMVFARGTDAGNRFLSSIGPGTSSSFQTQAFHVAFHLLN